MNEASDWLQAHLVTRENARFLNTLAQLLVAIVAAWYVARQVLARGNAAAALNV